MIDRIRAGAERYPGRAALVVAVAFPALGLAARLVVKTPIDLRAQLPREALGALVILLVTWLLGWQRRAGLSAPLRRPVNLLPLAALVVFTFGLDAVGVRQRGVHDLAAAGALALLVGVTEETLARGILLGGLAARGPIVAGAVSAVYFGLLHLGNLLIRFDVVVIAQALSAIMLGLLFGAVRLRVASLWPLVFTHALVDLPPLATGILVPPSLPSPWLALVPVVLIAPWGALGAAMLAWDEAHRA